MMSQEPARPAFYPPLAPPEPHRHRRDFPQLRPSDASSRRGAEASAPAQGDLDAARRAAMGRRQGGGCGIKVVMNRCRRRMGTAVVGRRSWMGVIPRTISSKRAPIPRPQGMGFADRTRRQRRRSLRPRGKGPQNKPSWRAQELFRRAIAATAKHNRCEVEPGRQVVFDSSFPGRDCPAVRRRTLAASSKHDDRVRSTLAVHPGAQPQMPPPAPAPRPSINPRHSYSTTPITPPSCSRRSGNILYAQCDMWKSASAAVERGGTAAWPWPPPRRAGDRAATLLMPSNEFVTARGGLWRMDQPVPPRLQEPLNRLVWADSDDIGEFRDGSKPTHQANLIEEFESPTPAAASPTSRARCAPVRDRRTSSTTRWHRPT